MSRVFLSHSSKDKLFVRRLARDLQHLGHDVWLDEWEIHVGESIITKVGTGIHDADFVAVLLSTNSTESGWVEREWQAKYWDEIESRRVMVLPLLIDRCTIPQLLRFKKYADFRSHYEVGLVELASSLRAYQDHSGIARYFDDFVDIADDWHRLFAQTRHLDLLVMYGGTWRYTYLKDTQEMLSRPGSRLRAVFPELALRSPLLRVYAERLATTQADILQRVTTAIDDVKGLATFGRVEIYTIPLYFYHACYLFDTGGAIALYSYKPERVATPAMILEDGSLLRFIRGDFDWIVSEQNPKRRVLFMSP